MSIPNNVKLTGKDVKMDKISLGGTEQKTSGKYNYFMTQVLYDEKPFVITETAKMKMFSLKKTFSNSLDVNKTNRDYFEKIEKRISELYDDLEIKLLKPTNDYLKVYAKLYSSNDKIYTPFRMVENGKKKLVDPKDYIGISFHGKIALKISRIYDGNCVSLICEAQEVLIEDFYHPPSIFDEYSDAEDSDVE